MFFHKIPEIRYIATEAEESERERAKKTEIYTN